MEETTFTNNAYSNECEGEMDFLICHFRI